MSKRHHAPDRDAEKSENLIKQDFTAEKPNETWLTDITEIPCRDENLYLVPALDYFDDAIVGMHTDTSRRTGLCCRAFENLAKDGRVNIWESAAQKMGAA